MTISYATLAPTQALAYRDLRLKSLQLFPQYFRSDYEQQRRLDKLYFEKLIEAQSDRGFMIGAFDSEKLVGICGVTLDTQLVAGAVEIIQMFVEPNYQGRGIGREMIEVACRSARDKQLAPIVTIQVDVDNASAKHLYLRCGFETLAGNRDPSALCMQRRL